MQNDDQESPSVYDTHLSAILDVVSEAVFVIDSNRRVLIANRAARILFDGPLVGQDFVRTVRHPDCLKCVDAVLAGEDETQAVVTFTRPISTVCRVNVIGLEPTHEAGPRAVVSIADISQVQDAEKMRSDFVANVSHELRSPLTALNGFIETLKGAAKDDPDAREHFLNIMEHESLRMKRLIDDLLSLSKVETNARVRPTESCDLPTIIGRVITTLSLQANERGKVVKLDHAESVPRIRGDSDELMQIFQNLIENAIKYSEPDSDVFVSIAEVENAAGVHGPALRVEVRDQGPGFERSHIPRLTERFYRVDDGRARDQGGTGLGLAIVKHIVSRHRGRLQIQSNIGVGSTFSVYLPIGNVAS